MNLKITRPLKRNEKSNGKIDVVVATITTIPANHYSTIDLYELLNELDKKQEALGREFTGCEIQVEKDYDGDIDIRFYGYGLETNEQYVQRIEHNNVEENKEKLAAQRRAITRARNEKKRKKEQEEQDRKLYLQLKKRFESDK